MAETQNQKLVFAEIDRLADYLSRKLGGGKKRDGHEIPTGTVDPKRYPIVLVPGFMGWASPVFGYSYFGGLVNLAEILASQGWSVICPQVGPVSSNWERACELYSQLARGSMDGTTYDIIVDYGVAIPGTSVFYSYPPPYRRQAACFNMRPNWRWGPDSPVHFVAHSQGGNTCRYLIHLLERGWSQEGSGYFTEPKKGWVKSLTTLATPHNGSSIINVLEDLGPAEDVLLDKIISASSFVLPPSRTFDFCLDHRGICPPTDPNINLLTYLDHLSSPDGALTKWRSSTYTGFYDNSILGVVGDMNKIIGPPSKDVYYFTLSFAATLPVPKISLGLEDMFSLPEGLVARMSVWLGGKVNLNYVKEKLPNSVVERLPASVLAKLSLGSSGSESPTTNTANTANTGRPSAPTWASYPASPVPHTGGLPVPPPSSSNINPLLDRTSPVPPGPLPLQTNFPPSTNITSPITEQPTSTSTRQLLLTLLRELFGSSLQDIATWALTRLNSRLPSNIPKLPLPGSTIPRVDMFPGFLIAAYPMGTFNLSPTEKELLEACGGELSAEAWREHDGVVPTCSMSGPWGEGNKVVKVDDIVRHGLGMEEGGRGLKGLWVDMGKCEWMDHADCIGSCFNPGTISEVVELYIRIGRLLEVLPVDRSVGERRGGVLL